MAISDTGLTALTALLLLSLSPGATQAETQTDLAQCRAITGSPDRLACYDKLVDAGEAVPVGKAPSGYKTIGMTDLKLDQSRMAGHRIETTGTLNMAGQVGLLGSDKKDSAPLPVDMAAVPREQRRTVLERCSDAGCAVLIRGTVGQVLSMPGLLADTIEVQSH